LKIFESVRIQQATALILSAFTYDFSFCTYAFPNTLAIRARKRVVLPQQLTYGACVLLDHD